MDARTAAAKILHEVIAGGRSLSDAFDDYLEKVQPQSDASLARALSFGTLRWQPRLDVIVNQLLARPLKRKDRDIYCLLLIGLYQLRDMRIPPHAAVAETVSVTRHLGKDWARGLVNGVLRNYQRRQGQIDAAADHHEEALWAHPRWLMDRIKASWPQHWQSILSANNRQPPLSLRVNRTKISRADYIETLNARGIAVEPIAYTHSGVVITQPVEVTELPGFRQGWCSAQDGAAQFAAPLLDMRSGQRVLDACCAPGGKTTHLLETEPTIELTAVDKSAQRLSQVEENLARLQQHARLVTGDAAAPGTWWDGRPFDRILLDTPCSATGVIRRHPDIKLLRRTTDIDALADLQQQLLRALWPLLKPGGMLLYVTCSVLAEENHSQISQFLGTHSDAREASLNAAWGHDCTHGRQLLPGEHDMDGFYYARLCKS